MAKKVNIAIVSQGGLNPLIDMVLDWTDDEDQTHHAEVTRQYNAQLNWLTSTYGTQADPFLRSIVCQIERVRQDIDGIEYLG